MTIQSSPTFQGTFIYKLKHTLPEKPRVDFVDALKKQVEKTKKNTNAQDICIFRHTGLDENKQEIEGWIVSVPEYSETTFADLGIDHGIPTQFNPQHIKDTNRNAFKQIANEFLGSLSHTTDMPFFNPPFEKGNQTT